MGAVTDDEVIRKRLLIDGDGAGDDRRINLLLKSFTKWCNSSGTPEEGFTQYQRMLGILAQCEFSMGKTLMVYDMNLREMENYEKIYSNIEQNISSAHEKIAECKKEIQRAKRIRKNRQDVSPLIQEASSVLRQKWVHPKDKPPKHKLSNIVYAVQCSKECLDLCTGETKQPLNRHMAQHRRETSVYILDREDRWFKRGVKEAIYVHCERPSLNRVGGLSVMELLFRDFGACVEKSRKPYEARIEACFFQSE